jgi:two-component system sensor histidine kinase/response regulator
MVDQLGRALQHLARTSTTASFCLAESDLPFQLHVSDAPIERFVVVVSQPFSGLLVAQASLPADAQLTLATAFLVRLQFEPSAIASFLTELSSKLAPGSELWQQLEFASTQVQPNDPTRQSEFALELTALLAGSLNPPSVELSPTGLSLENASCDLAVARALQQQIEQERLLYHVTSLIRQSIELPIVLNTTVQQVQQLLQVDRVVIYEFGATGEPQPPLTADPLGYGCITYEARAHAGIPSVLHLTERSCFADVPNYRAKYQKGFTLFVNDLDSDWTQSACLRDLMRQGQVRAKLVVPVVVQDELWGLLIVHQCQSPRQWQPHEHAFLRQIAEHLAIAIHQANLYAQVQAQKQVLAQQVDKRTHELYDALSAAQAAYQTKAEFLATMSHELRTPLTSIIGMTTTLLRSSSGGRLLSVERQQAYLRTIQTSGEHLLQLINDILDLSDVESGRMVLSLQTFSLTRLAKECLRILEPQAHQAAIALELELLLPTQPAHSGSATVESATDQFRADPNRLRQVLLNLLSNAVKFTPAGGRVVLRIWKEQDTAVFQVEDTGIGIAESQRSLLFERFQQLDMSHHRTYSGAGVGLALTKQLVDLHRGWIEVESKLNVGSTFTVWIPPQSLEPPESSLREARQEAASYHTAVSGQIVLIESHEPTATLFCDLLTTAGYQVVWIIEGSAAVSQVEILLPNLVLLSHPLLGTSPAEILLHLRQNPQTQAIPVLLLGKSRDRIPLEADDSLEAATTQPEQLLTKVAALIRRRWRESVSE